MFFTIFLTVVKRNSFKLESLGLSNVMMYSHVSGKNKKPYKADSTGVLISKNNYSLHISLYVFINRDDPHTSVLGDILHSLVKYLPT